MVVASATFGASGNDNNLVHDWRQDNGPGEVKFISNHRAPLPFSETGEPEATLTMQASKIPDNVPLSRVVEVEIKGIRNGTEIGEYLEEDGHKPDNGIVSYVEEINGHKVAFIKYRVAGVKGKSPVSPRSFSHAILLKNGKVYFVHLIVLFAGHQEEVRADQIRLVKGILRN
jgi:hypothetical protein